MASSGELQLRRGAELLQMRATQARIGEGMGDPRVLLETRLAGDAHQHLAETMAEAILRAVRLAKGLGGVPGLKK